MEQETKTVTMPMSEFEDMRARLAQHKILTKTEVDKVRAELEEKIKENEKLREEAKESLFKIQSYESRCTRLEKEVDNLRSSWIAISNEKRELEREKESLGEELAKCKEEVYAKRVYLKSLEDAIEKLQTENEMLRKDLEEEEEYKEKPKDKWYQFWK